MSWRRARDASVPRSAWALPVLVSEVLLLSWYDDRGERSHWLTHLLVGAVVGLLGLTFWVRARGRPPGSRAGVPVAVLAVVTAQLLGTAPDLLEGAGLRQGRWMDVFLGSVSAHYAPRFRRTDRPRVGAGHGSSVGRLASRCAGATSTSWSGGQRRWRRWT